MLIKWTAIDGTPQKIDILHLIKYEQAKFAQYVERLPEQPTARQIKKGKQMIADIDRLKAIADRISSKQRI